MRSPLLPFPQLLFPRLRRALNRLALGIWHDPLNLEVSRTEARRGEFPFADARRAKRKPMTLPGVWQAPGFSTTWFRVRLPAGRKARPGDHLRWEDNAEATAWADGEPLYGFDATHRQWPWPAGAREVWIESIFCQSGIWHAAAKGIGPLGSVLTQACLVQKSEEAWQAYFDLEVLTDWLEEEIRRVLPQDAENLLAGFRAWPEMDGASGSFLPDGVGTGVANRHRPDMDRLPPLLRSVFALLDEAVTAFHAGGPAALRRKLAPVYRLLREQEAAQPRVTLTGHAHIDLVWLWPEKTGEQKAVRTFATVNRLVDAYPEFYFGYSQPASYAAVQRRAPGLMRKVKRQIRGGRWEALGAMYIESDTLLACGEALLRSLTLGQEDFRRINGKPSPVLWLPDAFGFTACLPALMRLADVTGFYTNKLSWNMIHRFPHSSFVWRGADGSEVLAHVSRATGYNNPARPRNLRLEAEAHRQADRHPEFLLPSGWGDGGGGPTADIIERVRRQADLRNQPPAQWGRIDAFYRRMEAVRAALPVWQGEIYLEAHRGTYTTHGWMKEAYRRLERALQAWEAARCAGGGGPIPAHPWQRLVFAQFHDFLPGSSIHEVYEEMVPELQALEKEALREAKASLGAGKGGAGFFNPQPHPLPAQAGGKTVVVPPLGHSSSGAAAAGVTWEKSTLANGLAEARFDAKGSLRSLDRQDVAGTRLVAYRDVPYDLEAWEIDRQALDAGTPLVLDGAGKPASGPGWKGVRQRWKTAGGSTVDLFWKLRSGFSALEAELDVDWREPETLLRFEVPTPFRGQAALFGAPYGGAWRPQQPGDSRASAQWEAPASRWVLSSDDGRQQGVFLLAEAKYGFSARDGILGVSLLKSAKVTLTNAFPAAFRVPGPRRDAFSDLGKSRIRIALGVLGAHSRREAYPAALAETLFAEPLAAPAPRRAFPFPVLEGMPSVLPAWAAPIGKNRWVLRLHETMGRSGTLRVAMPAGWTIRRLEKAFPGPGDRALPGGRIEVAPFAVLGLEIRQ
ncbi:MAG: glycoside hydrolase family 38 C-terminal domain-containing protein [Verrucomicrobium sp.]|nr:glycoside hydrolase family 38 C-terminal domain-containing protein [Verrucomicrobium sp.]